VPIIAAARSGFGAVPEVLVDANADVAAAPGTTSALHEAAAAGHTAAVAELIRADRNRNRLLRRSAVDATDDVEQTPLHLAAREGAADCVALLVGAQAALEAATHSGATPLALASLKGHGAAVRVLLLSRAVANAQNRAGLTPLTFAVREAKSDDCVSVLLDAKADASESIVEAAVQSGSAPSLAALLAHGAPRPALQACVAGGHIAILRAVLAAGADPAAEPGLFGSSPPDSFPLLLEIRAEVDALYDGRTALHTAAAAGDQNTVAGLLRARADPNVRLDPAQSAAFFTSGRPPVSGAVPGGATALDIAAERAQWGLFPRLLEALLSNSSKAKLTKFRHWNV